MNYLDDGYTRNSWRDTYAEHCAENTCDNAARYDWETENSVYFFTAPQLSYNERWRQALTER